MKRFLCFETTFVNQRSWRFIPLQHRIQKSLWVHLNNWARCQSSLTGSRIKRPKLYLNDQPCLDIDCSSPKSYQLIHESKWTSVPHVKKSSEGVNWGVALTRSKTCFVRSVILILHQQIHISSSIRSNSILMEFPEGVAWDMSFIWLPHLSA